MGADDIVKRIEASPLQPEINAILEVELSSPSDVATGDYQIEPPDSQSFALDGAGGTFNILSDGRILLVDSEGSFGVIAGDFTEFVATATGLASWRDALRFTGEPDLGKARGDWEAYVYEWRLDAAMNEPWPYAPQGFSIATPGQAREAIRAYFGVTASTDPFGALYQAVNEMNDDVSVSSGSEPLLLFGREP